MQSFNLKELREAHGLTQEGAAKSFGVSLSTWQRHELSGSIPRLWELAVIGFMSTKGI